MAGRRSVAVAEGTRQRILRKAADIASIDGLDGLSIGQLANDLEMSKAGVIGHFGSKEELQLATIDLAADIFRAVVWDPVQSEPPGRPRLLAVCDTWSDYMAKPPYPGGCVMATASMEYAGRSGRVHERLGHYMNRWHNTLADEVHYAIEHGQLPGPTDANTIAYVLQALTSAVKIAKYLTDDPDAADRCRTAMRALLAPDAG